MAPEQTRPTIDRPTIDDQPLVETIRDILINEIGEMSRADAFAKEIAAEARDFFVGK